MPPSCLIVGAGMAGLTAAGVLAHAGWSVTLVDKGRSVGGRMATRRIGESRFDHGAQFFTVRDERFRQAIQVWESDGAVVPWFLEGGHVPYRAGAGMNGSSKPLAKPFAVRTGTPIKRSSPWAAVACGDASGRVVGGGCRVDDRSPTAVGGDIGGVYTGVAGFHRI